jgi:hypothetical protein
MKCCVKSTAVAIGVTLAIIGFGGINYESNATIMMTIVNKRSSIFAIVLFWTSNYSLNYTKLKINAY